MGEVNSGNKKIALGRSGTRNVVDPSGDGRGRNRRETKNGCL